MTKYNKQQAISIIIDCAAKYEENLNGYQLLFILKDKHKHISSLEVSFYPYNFLHLTGIKLIDGTTATDFYKPIATLEYMRKVRTVFCPDFLTQS